MTVAIWLIVALVIAVIVVGAIIAMAVVSAKKETVTVTGEGSYFDGNTWQLIGYRILSALVTTITLSIAYPWMLCMVQRWEVKHTVINGRRLKFNGTGEQLIGKWILWVFLTIITFGIYGIWLGLGMKKWVVKHTVYADEERPVGSYFSGGAGGFLGIHLLSFVLTVFTLGIGKAWADRMVLCWEAEHTHIGGSPLEFVGKGGQLFVKYLLLGLLTPLTLGIYAIFFPVIYIKWETKNTVAVYQKPEIQAEARAHEIVAVQDYAKYRIAANDTEIAMMKSGYTGKETTEELEALAEQGNPYACYRLATQLKADAPVYENRALELLQIAANANYYPAQFDLAQQLPKEQAIPMLEDAARNGSSVAPWLLVNHYNQSSLLKEAAYWFKVALEWGDSNALAQRDNYDIIIKNIALQLSEKQQQTKSNSTLPIVLGIVGGIVVLILVGGFLPRAIFGVRIFGLSLADKASAKNEQFADLDTEGEKTEAIHVGDYVYFGTYEQDNNTSNGKEAIEWLVLDKQGDSVLVISKYALDCQPYNEELTDITWETCSLRKWLNNTFINNAFSTEEQAIIQTTTVSADKNSNYSTTPGNATQDRVFLLSVNEVYNYFESNNARKCGTTEYAEAQNVYTSSSHSADGKATCYWWLRSPGDSQVIAARVGIDGHIVNVGNGVNNDRYAVRPALWITLQGDEVVKENRINLSDTTQSDSTDNQSEDTQNNDVQNTETPTTTETPTVNITDSIVGEWVRYDMVTSIYTGDNRLYISTKIFNSDGTYKTTYYECVIDVNGREYYGGQYWTRAGGDGGSGTYTFDGNILTVTSSEYNSGGVYNTETYQVSLNGNTLELTNSERPEIYERVE